MPNSVNIPYRANFPKFGVPIANKAHIVQPYNPSQSLPTSALDVINNIQDENLRNEYLYNYYGVRDQQEFAERMARNSYSYAVEDLKRAGLNPYLLYSNGGSGAVTPSSSAYSSSGYASSVYSSERNFDSSVYRADSDRKARNLASFLGLVGDVLSSVSDIASFFG